MRRQDLWRKIYEESPRLEHVGPDELEQRFRDIFVNLTVVTPEGKMAPVLGLNFDFWMVRWTAIVEEYMRRGGIPSVILAGTDMPLLYDGPHPGWTALNGRKPPRGLLKFGTREHLRAALERGSFLIRPASWYAAQDPSLNPAMCDDELNLDFAIWPGDFPEGDPRRVAAENVTAHVVKGTDYYVYCVSMVYVTRLFDDFKGDACLVMRDPNLGPRFLEGVAEQLPGGKSAWVGGLGAVQYVDPLQSAELVLSANPHEIFDPFFAKPFRFAYQAEARFIWVPKENRPRGMLESVPVELGSLAHYCDLIELPEPYEKRRTRATWSPPKALPRFDDAAGTGIDGLLAGPEVDALIYENLMQPPPPRLEWPDRPTEARLPYSTDYQSALTVVTRLGGYGWVFWLDVDRELMRRRAARAKFHHDDGRSVEAQASTYELAVCRAALKAAIAQGLWDGVLPEPVSTNGIALSMPERSIE
ncbi:MAG TPA: hypothetical protein VGQ75_10435 [Thermoanaerobaculia bacterium]|jgi:hypothetical protein|nr:hypothetical protein [Thermoanaerobaculia bacterium]HEV8608872.1 hypothetical protein [Thermoanaerobaculia bacterium]